MLSALSLLVKIVLHTGLLGAGGLALHSAILRSRWNRLIAICAFLIIFAIGARLLLLNAELAGGLNQIFNFEMFGWVWNPNRLQSFAYLGGAVVMALGVLLKRRAGLLIGAASLFLGIGLGGHVSGLEAPTFSRAVVSAHVAIAAFWVTAPIVLWPTSDIDDAALAHQLKRFSAIAMWSVPLMFAGGVWLSLRLTGSPEALVSSDYGRLLMVKLVLASAALALGAGNKFWITRRIERRDDAGRKWLKRTLFIDILIFSAIIVAIAAATTLTGPDA